MYSKLEREREREPAGERESERERERVGGREREKKQNKTTTTTKLLTLKKRCIDYQSPVCLLIFTITKLKAFINELK